MTDPLLDSDLEELVRRAAGASAIFATEPVQELWSGYGQIVRAHLVDADRPAVIVKHVRWPDERSHPRGWTTDRAHERKVESYRVETNWYEWFAVRCGDESRVPACLAVEAGDDEVVIVLEDLDAGGFPGRRSFVDEAELEACVRWLAEFHATFLDVSPEGLWPVGTYWHLATRPDELDALPDGPLKSAAAALDGRLSASPFQTIVHGDAKLANFCFSADGRSAAAVDFQYVGGGCGMKDLAYFVSSCFHDADCERLAPGILDRYFELLRAALVARDTSVDLDALEADWRALYPVAWTDFTRFLQGWSPGHWKLHAYSERLAAEVIDDLERS